MHRPLLWPGLKEPSTEQATEMPALRTLALDAMGGDHGPEVVIPGAALSLSRHPESRFVFFGDRTRIQAELKRAPALLACSSVVHTDVAIGMDDKPSQALRRGKGSSMWLALEAVQKGEARAAVSAGNTGALMAMSRLVLRPMAGIERPAIAALWPTVTGHCVMLDAGANIGASARQLVDFALMGAAMARVVFNVERPTVGLLNVGVEEIKGADEVKEAHTWLKDLDLDLPIAYRGYVEGDQIGQGVVDVVVSEGFSGNIALKTAEGTAKQVASYLKAAMTLNWMTRLGALLARSGFDYLKQKMDPRHSNGGTFLGLNGIAIKSHGGADALGFASAVDLGYQMAESGLIERLAQDVEAFHARLGEPKRQLSNG
jgi:glycerol-3-phosphate acyltransferase PlsX